VLTVESAIANEGVRVRFEDLLDTAVVWWTTGAPSPKGGCVYSVRALPVRPTALGWEGTPKEIVRHEIVSGSAACTEKAPPARVRVLGGEIWAALGGEEIVRVAGVDYDGKPSAYKLPAYPGGPGAMLDIFRIDPYVILRADKTYVGWKLEIPPQEAAKLPGLVGNVVGIGSAGWVVGGDGGIRHLADPTAPSPKAAAKIPPADPSGGARR
jgi:hypothetical protein